MNVRRRLAEISASIVGADQRARRRGLATLALLLAVWAALSAAHLLSTRGFLASENWLLSKDGGYAEEFGYALQLASAGAFALLFARRRESLYLAVGAVLLYIVADDAFGFHEAVGRLYENAGLTSSIPHVRAAHLGQFLYLGGAGAALLTALFLAARKADRPARDAAWVIGGLVCGIGMCGAVIDTVSDWLVSSQLAFLDDCGELFFMVLIAAYSVFLVAQTPARLAADAG